MSFAWGDDSSWSGAEMAFEDMSLRQSSRVRAGGGRCRATSEASINNMLQQQAELQRCQQEYYRRSQRKRKEKQGSISSLPIMPASSLRGILKASTSAECLVHSDYLDKRGRIEDENGVIPPGVKAYWMRDQQLRRSLKKGKKVQFHENSEKKSKGRVRNIGTYVSSEDDENERETVFRSDEERYCRKRPPTPVFLRKNGPSQTKTGSNQKGKSPKESQPKDHNSSDADNSGSNTGKSKGRDAAIHTQLDYISKGVRPPHIDEPCPFVRSCVKVAGDPNVDVITFNALRRQSINQVNAFVRSSNRCSQRNGYGPPHLVMMSDLQRASIRSQQPAKNHMHIQQVATGVEVDNGFRRASIRSSRHRMSRHRYPNQHQHHYNNSHHHHEKNPDGNQQHKNDQEQHQHHHQQQQHGTVNRHGSIPFERTYSTMGYVSRNEKYRGSISNRNSERRSHKRRSAQDDFTSSASPTRQPSEDAKSETLRRSTRRSMQLDSLHKADPTNPLMIPPNIAFENPALNHQAPTFPTQPTERSLAVGDQNSGGAAYYGNVHQVPSPPLPPPLPAQDHIIELEPAERIPVNCHPEVNNHAVSGEDTTVPLLARPLAEAAVAVALRRSARQRRSQMASGRYSSLSTGLAGHSSDLEAITECQSRRNSVSEETDGTDGVWSAPEQSMHKALSMQLLSDPRHLPYKTFPRERQSIRQPNQCCRTSHIQHQQNVMSEESQVLETTRFNEPMLSSPTPPTINRAIPPPPPPRLDLIKKRALLQASVRYGSCQVAPRPPVPYYEDQILPVVNVGRRMVALPPMVPPKPMQKPSSQTVPVLNMAATNDKMAEPEKAVLVTTTTTPVAVTVTEKKGTKNKKNKDKKKDVKKHKKESKKKKKATKKNNDKRKKGDKKEAEKKEAGKTAPVKPPRKRTPGVTIEKATKGGDKRSNNPEHEGESVEQNTIVEIQMGSQASVDGGINDGDNDKVDPGSFKRLSRKISHRFGSWSKALRRLLSFRADGGVQNPTDSKLGMDADGRINEETQKLTSTAAGKHGDKRNCGRSNNALDQLAKDEDHLNFCDEGKTNQIIDWLQEIYSTQTASVLAATTVATQF